MIWSTSLCKHKLEIVNNFENHRFPNEFSVTIKDLSHWINSDAAFWNCYVKDGLIVSDISFIITTVDFYFGILNGELLEKDIQPYSGKGKPILYFSSLILESNTHSPILFKNIFNEIRAYIYNEEIELNSCFTIAASIENTSIYEKFGFHEKGKYINKYKIMTMEKEYKKSIFNRLIEQQGITRAYK